MRSIAVLLLAGASLFAADSAIWKVAPPPPVSWERDRVSDLAAHRRAVEQQIGEKGVLILLAAEPRNYAGDVEWPYRQENDFFYLTGISQPGSVLVLMPGAAKYREILFMPPSNPAQEVWTGHLLTPAEARAISGIQDIWDVRLANLFFGMLAPAVKSGLLPEPAPGPRRAAAPPAPLPEDVGQIVQKAAGGDMELFLVSHGLSAEFHREIALAADLTKAGLTVKDAGPIFTTMRRVKSPREIDLLRHAADITAEAFQRAYAVAVPGTWEYEIQAQFEFTFLRRDAHWGYPCIVASGLNATTLHYETNRDRMKAGDLLLLDNGAEFDGYSADVTRTIPVSGKYSREQADIYRLVWAAQQAAIDQMRPGHTLTGADSITGAAGKVFKEGLVKLGLMTDTSSDQQLRVWLNHGISHGVGLNVHDPTARELQPGMVVTIEPGLYFRPDALENLAKTPENEKFIAAVRPAFEKYKGIGVRIEDDVLVTAGAPQVISASVPSKLEDVEATIARLRKTLGSRPAAMP